MSTSNYATLVSNNNNITPLGWKGYKCLYNNPFSLMWNSTRSIWEFINGQVNISNAVLSNYNPTQDVTLYEWWNASNIGGGSQSITQSGGYVSVWTGYNGNQWQQSTGSNQFEVVSNYLNGHNGLYSPHTSCMYLPTQLTISTPCFVLVICQLNSQEDAIYADSPGSYNLVFFTYNLGSSSSIRLLWNFYSSSTDVSYIINIPTTNLIMEQQYNSSSPSYEYQSNTLENTISYGAPNIKLGLLGTVNGGWYLDGYITDMCIWTDSPTSAQIAQRVGYFQNLYNIQ